MYLYNAIIQADKLGTVLNVIRRKLQIFYTGRIWLSLGFGVWLSFGEKKKNSYFFT